MIRLKDLNIGDEVYWIKNDYTVIINKVIAIKKMENIYTSNPNLKFIFKNDLNYLAYYYEPDLCDDNYIDDVMTTDFEHLDGKIFLNKEDVIDILNNHIQFINEQMLKIK